MDILIIGSGFVGKALGRALSRTPDTTFGGHTEHWVKSIDRDQSVTDVPFINNDFYPDYTFLCLPTPADDESECDISILLDVLPDVKKTFPMTQVVVRSTVTPDKAEELLGIDPTLIFNPEFMRANHADHDVMHPSIMVYGGEYERCWRLQRLYDTVIHTDGAEQIFLSHEEACLYKYAMNTFLAMKVVWANEMSHLHSCLNGEIDWDAFQLALGRDPRMGQTHMQVPGPDGKDGFGGACFPKDTAALWGFARRAGVEMKLLETTIMTNYELRDE